MEENKKSNVTTIVIVAAICILVGVLSFIIGKKFFDKTNENKPEEQITTPTDNQETPDDVTVEEDELSIELDESSKKYTVYSSINNQDWYDSVVGYKGVLFYITETEKNLCKTKLLNTKIENYADCVDYEETNEYDETVESEDGSYTLLNVKESDVRKAYVMQSQRTDGASVVFIVFKNGKVNSYIFIDSGIENEDIFKGYKVKEISKYKCSKTGEDGCEKESFTLILEDGSKKTIERNVEF